MIEQPSQARYNIDYDQSGMQIKIPSRKNWFQIIFMGIWSIIWLFATLGVVTNVVVSAISAFISPKPNAQPFSLVMLFPGLFMLVWLTFWVSGGLFAVYSLLRQLIGCEIIEIHPQTISITPKVLGFEKPKTYDAGYIKNLRVSPYVPQSTWFGGYNRQFWMRNTGTLAFDYGAKTIRFGDMDEAEAKMALNDLLQYYPNYGR
jgi:hypothetical protein